MILIAKRQCALTCVLSSLTGSVLDEIRALLDSKFPAIAGPNEALRAAHTLSAVTVVPTTVLAASPAR